MNVSRETEEALQEFANLLLKWNKAINLVAKSTLSEVYNRHILDSLQISDHVTFGENWIDMGSGGGLPAVVLAIAAKGQGANTRFALVESDQRKCAFLRTVSAHLSLNLKVEAIRAEAYPARAASHVSARALASLDKLFEYTQPFFTPETVGVFPKGETHLSEISEAQKKWTFDYDLVTSRTNPSAAIVLVRNLQ